MEAIQKAMTEAEKKLGDAVTAFNLMSPVEQTKNERLMLLLLHIRMDLRATLREQGWPITHA